MKIVFIDPKCPAPYDSEVLLKRGLGGTEATVIRIARALSRTHEVAVIQHNRTERRTENANLVFAPQDHMEQAVTSAHHVVFIQKAQAVNKIAKLSSARLWLWLHNFLKDEVPYFVHDHLRHRLGIICVSRTHAQHTRDHVRSLPAYWASFGAIARGGILYHHNPIDEALTPDPQVTKDPHKLVFFSSPYKGIEHVIAAFNVVHAIDPRFKLFVANPGYVKNFDVSLLDAPGIVQLGSLPQLTVLQHVKEALCVFYPQRKRPETFGLVYAESNAVGTPVLAHDFGAAREILAESNVPFDTNNTVLVTETLLDWALHGAPKVSAQSNFSLNSVAEKWLTFFQNPEEFIRHQATN